MLKKKNFREFFIAGDIVSLNPSAVPEQLINEWQTRGLIKYLVIKNIVDVLREMSIACLPSWRRIPKIIMEAASLGLPVITTDVPGCRDAVINNKTGIVVPAKNAKALAKAIEILLSNPKLSRELGEIAVCMRKEFRF